MANLEVNAASSVCRKCGRAYGRLKGYFPVCYSYLSKGIGYLPYCSDCCKNMFDSYYAECGDERNAMHQLCRKLDLYWSDELYEKAANKTGIRTLLQNYIARLNNAMYAGRSYDDTLRENKMLWVFDAVPPEDNAVPEYEDDDDDDEVLSVSEIAPIEITDDIIAFWGPGYTREMYQELEQRLRYYTSQMGEDADMDMGTEALLRQIAMMEIDINKARASGVPVDKMVNSLNSLLSALKKPQKTQTDTASSNTPFGVWIKKWEDERPIPEVDESMKDVDGIVKYVLTWVYGHLAHMLKIKNARTPLYDDAIARLRVDRPEYDEEDDESLLYDLFGDGTKDAEDGG